MSTTLTENHTLVPPADAIRAAMAEMPPRLRGIVTFISALDSIQDGTATVTMEGMTITLPNPFHEFPEVGAALRRAKSRSRTYGEGNMHYFHWMMYFAMYDTTFAAYATRIATVYNATPPAGPSAEQRKVVMDSFASLIAELVSHRQYLVRAEASFIATITLLDEDQRALGEGSPGMNRAISRYEEVIRDQVLKFSLQPTSAGLAKIMSKAGGAQLEHLRQARTSITSVASLCGKARDDVALLAGKILTLIGQYQGVQAALARADDAAFVQFMGKFQLTIARETWTNLSDYAKAMIRG